MRLRKWLMKQQWRVVQIRGIWSLFYGVLMLAYAYYAVVPLFSGMGALGPFAFAAILLAVYLVLGYLYDRVFVMWAPSQEVNIERNPYQYVPSPKDRVFWFPLYSVLLDATEALARESGVDCTAIEDARNYFWELQQLVAERRNDIDEAIR
ncbi:MAG: hypothetical protein DRQ06_04725, partial [Candidatus Hydrothermota bacterium]